MPDAGNRVLVTNTTPLIALTAATGGLEILRHLCPNPCGFNLGFRTRSTRVKPP